MGLGKKGFDLIAPHGGGIGLQGCGFTNTPDCLQSGIVYGTAAMLDGMVQRFCAKLNAPGAAVGRDPGARFLLLNRSQG